MTLIFFTMICFVSASMTLVFGFILSTCALFKPLKKTKLVQSYLLRLRWENHLQLKSKIPTAGSGQEVYWIHAASGEIEYAKPLLRELKLRDPACFILLTYSSVSAVDFLGNLPEIDVHCPLPLDFYGQPSRLMLRFRPKILLIARSDLWPITIHECRKHKIKTLLFATTQSKPLTWGPKKWMLKMLNHISFVTDDDCTNAQLSEEHTSIDGDPRYDQVLWRIANKKETLPLKAFLGNSPLVVFGSTWNEDLVALATFLRDLRFHFVLVPHEWNHEAELFLKKILSGRLWKKYSDLRNAPHNFALLEGIVVDEKGLLAELYSEADAVFVGGSFKKKVHSVMEPLACGKPVFVGPFYKNNREAIEFSQKFYDNHSFVEPIENGSDLAPRILSLLTKPIMNEKILSEVSSRQGATLRLLEQMELVLKKQ